ncbi:MAG TPA: enoyl-CoA hydratase family protein [Planctomycetota bacterium]|nr:enoyl-CoA hydratase family protein [Planctomycetota bacterium]
MDPRHFRYSERDGVATIRLDRPERLNALTFDSYAELRDTFAALRTRASVRSVVITGTGRAFCSGGDVRDIIGRLFGVSDAELLAFTRMTCDLIENMRRLEKPIVAALNGTVCGAGAVIAAASDVRVASDDARIAFLFVKVGLCGADMGAAWLLPRIVGLGHASELLMLGDFITAARAYEIGLYNKVVAREKLESEANDWAARLAAGPTLGLAMTKRMLQLEDDMPLGQAMQLEGWIQAECMKHPDYREAYEASVAKRPPDFTRNAPGRQAT